MAATPPSEYAIKQTYAKEIMITQTPFVFVPLHSIDWGTRVYSVYSRAAVDVALASWLRSISSPEMISFYVMNSWKAPFPRWSLLETVG